MIVDRIIENRKAYSKRNAKKEKKELDHIIRSLSQNSESNNS